MWYLGLRTQRELFISGVFQSLGQIWGTPRCYIHLSEAKTDQKLVKNGQKHDFITISSQYGFVNYAETRQNVPTSNRKHFYTI